MGMRADLHATAGVGGTPVFDPGPVRKVTAADVPALATAMAAAFFDDPVASWCFSNASRRLRRLERGFALFVRRLYLPHDECYTTDSLVGGALWVPPGQWRTGPVEQLRLLPALARILGGELPRLLRLLAAQEAQHPSEPHYHLPFVGVEPRSQGRGIGSALMGPILERCDRDGVAAYLEASSEHNRTLYERHGFEVTSVLEPPGGCPPMWLMWRTPREL